ncbi:ATP-binding SpoIIE family protein phosphatase [Aliikangiella coralliicola]|uniref:Fused response regulator/phosphatase n=1 Tax=Aliikangiella coralliicola TaxID=2592383 RepID=A0A545UB65_9GAMM|nr:SpoIIE family protein phosphatase [Aliikangiella coralliicola]TQV86710.1 fused response regulator/phosphatase [Aliikangiella coralliicola]
MKILIADDNSVERLILSKVLEQEGHEVVQAETGNQAIDFFFRHSPSLVFLDILMPDIDGYEVASAITRGEQSRWVPIIFLTSLTDAYDLAKCIDCGGDDFVSKPINRIIIKAKVDAFSRIANLYETIEQQKSEIQFHNDHLIQEQEAAKKIFNNIAHRGCLAAGNINYHLSPMSIFNGDLMLAAETPMGGMRLMLADFTGHGLPAAIGAMPTSEIFYGMTKKGFVIPDVMTEMNTRLHSVLPRGVFCCVVVADIDALDERITIWNAGAPQAYIIDLESGDVEQVHSNHLPLGVQSPQRFKVNPQVFSFSKKHKLLAVTDGIIESTNEQGEMYGEERMLHFIQNNLKIDNLCSALIDQIVEFTHDAEQGDDLSLIEVAFPHHHLEQQTAADDDEVHAQTGTLDSNFSLCLRGKSLGKFDPIPLLLQTLLECRELTPHRSRIFTVLSELYNNALEHGVLGLDSEIKSGSEGFAKYYQMRTEGLVSLREGFVKVEVDHRPLKDGGEIIFEFVDSGKGFDFKKVIKSGSKHYSGRGLPLLMNLCESIEHFDDGRRIRAVYRWHAKDPEDES